MMKRRILLCLSVLLLTGCGRDAAQLTVVTGLGVDGQPGEYQIGAEVIRLTDQSDSGQSTFLSGDGLTLTDGINRMVSMTGRSLYCNHTQVLLVSRKTAHEGIRPLLEELLRGNQYPVSLRLAVVKESACKAMQAKPVVSDMHSVELEDMIREGSKQCLSPDVDVCSFYQEVAAPGIEGILPFMEMRQNGKDQVCTLSGAALFQGENMMSVLNERDTRCLLWMRGQKGGTLVTEHAVFEVVSLNREIKAFQEQGTLHIKLTLKASENEDQKEALKQEAQDALQMQCESLLRQLKMLKCDAVGFGNQIYRTKQKDWNPIAKQWPELFSEYPIEVQVTVEDIIWGRIWSTEGTKQLEEAEYGS